MRYLEMLWWKIQWLMPSHRKEMARILAMSLQEHVKEVFDETYKDCPDTYYDLFRSSNVTSPHKP